MRSLKGKNGAAVVLFVIGALTGKFPSFAKNGLLTNASNSELAILGLMLWMTAMILFYLPGK